MIWYGYDQSNEFPWLGANGVNPMSGPIYHGEDYITSENSFPPYFENKWFVYEWMRDWIYVVHLDEKGQYVQADPFMPSTEFSHPMDMLFAKDGKLYVLEYGQKWNTRNLDARLSVINYVPGNRPPIARFEGDKEVGAAPLKVRFSAAESLDYDQDKVNYTWSFGEQKMKTDSPTVDFTFENPGIYDVELTVTDPAGESSSMSRKVMVGNEPPKVKMELSDRGTIYQKGKQVNYKIHVSDLEDGNTSDASLDLSKVKVTLNYLPEGEDVILASIGHQQSVVPNGLKLINASGCKSCHAIEKKVAGPSYRDVAIRYEQKDKQNIIRRIAKGSQGIWGENMMAAHPQLKLDEVEEMVNYILSLDPNKQKTEQKVPLEGSITFDEHLEDEVAGKYILMASYLDQGHPEIEGSALSAFEQIVFRAPKIEMENIVDLDKELGIFVSQGRTLVGSIKDGQQFNFGVVNFDGLSSIIIGAAFHKGYSYYGEVEIRLGKADGKLLGKGIIQYNDKKNRGFEPFEIKIEPTNEVGSLVFVFKNPKDKDQFIMNGDWIHLNYN